MCQFFGKVHYMIMIMVALLWMLLLLSCEWWWFGCVLVHYCVLYFVVADVGLRQIIYKDWCIVWYRFVWYMNYVIVTIYVFMFAVCLLMMCLIKNLVSLLIVAQIVFALENQVYCLQYKISCVKLLLFDKLNMQKLMFWKTT